MRRTTARKAVATTPIQSGSQKADKRWTPSAVMEIQAKARMIGLGFMKRELPKEPADRDYDGGAQEREPDDLQPLSERGCICHHRDRRTRLRRALRAPAG